ncbi:hypothetical protein [Terriglobus roseus]|uniref:Membrane protein 6-pyruvoyl-tetrahydropterin synthase-related domain-containing protein n=1 Tax=Terriglobus roseus TaxID=392734 RepID=A0A1G7EUS1_9BACT|nr:hypothetical protein [Terriglobus roseus]SDE67424.1 hypothetical protein SAMN05444167_0104 [Terriglobus roseus]
MLDRAKTQTKGPQHFVTRADVLAWIVLAIAAVLASLPLLTRGYSCGHDFDFHLRSWMEASTQWKGGIVKPVWAFHAAWDAGEPRLLFYPPLSWMTGALLTLLLPWSGIVFSFTALILFLCGVSMHRLLRRWVSPGLAVLGGCLYLVNPYMLFCAYERTAYAELMAAAWMPLLLIGLLRERVTAWRIAVAIALLWISNAPAAVVGCYTMLLIGGMRWLYLLRKDRNAAWPYFGRVTAGFLLGVLLDAFYLFPFAVERKFITLNAALTPAASPEANYLFAYSKDEFHNGVLLHSSTIALVLVAAALVCGGVALLLQRKQVRAFAGMHDRDASLQQHNAWRIVVPLLMIYSVIVLVLQTPVSGPVWHHAPQLNFLQFPWRFLAMQGAVSVTVVMLMVKRITASHAVTQKTNTTWIVAGLVLTLVAAYGLANPIFRQGCDDEEGLAPQWTFFHRGDGFEQTDEYTPTHDDNDVLKIKLPAAWIAQDVRNQPASGNGSFPKGTPLPAEQIPHSDDLIFTAHATHADDVLIVRLRPFYGWHVVLDGVEQSALPQRPDGLLAVPLNSVGKHRVEARYRKPWDQWAGGALSLLGLGFLIIAAKREESSHSSLLR